MNTKIQLKPHLCPSNGRRGAGVVGYGHVDRFTGIGEYVLDHHAQIDTRNTRSVLGGDRRAALAERARTRLQFVLISKK